MQAVILAAGMGKRLKKLTSNNTKCMVKVNGVTMIERLLRQIDRRNVSKIIIVVGYEGEKLKEYIATLGIETQIEFINNPIYDKTNNIYSLFLASEYLIKEDTLLFESDLIFEDKVLDDLINDKRETLALVDKYESWMDGTVVKIDEEDNIVDFIPGKNFVFEDIDSYYKTVNIYKFSKEFSTNKYVPFLKAYQIALGRNEYYEQVLKIITLIDNPEIKVKRLSGEKWYEIDDIQDLDIATSIFSERDEDRYDLLSGRYGGYWRYPKLLDYCYLVNPYYPPKKMLDEIKANVEMLVTQYPSGMKVLSLLAAKNFDVDQEHIVVGNGAAELIKAIIEESEGNIGFIRPSFEEYYNRYDKERSIVFNPKNEDFSYTAEDIISYFDNKNLSAIVLINPDNPSGNYISKTDVIKIAEWSKLKEIVFLYDESFIDFTEEDNSTMISEDIINKYPNMLVIKSISKSYGVAGLRLGVCVSSNISKIASLKKYVSIWNINSIAEFYLQIAEKYKKDYKNALIMLKEARQVLFDNLKNINGLRVFHSEANYIMVELCDGIKAKTFCRQMLSEKNILIKDLSSKFKNTERQFVRIAVRTIEENNILIDAIKNYIK